VYTTDEFEKIWQLVGNWWTIDKKRNEVDSIVTVYSCKTLLKQVLSKEKRNDQNHQNQVKAPAKRKTTKKISTGCQRRLKITKYANGNIEWDPIDPEPHNHTIEVSDSFKLPLFVSTVVSKELEKGYEVLHVRKVANKTTHGNIHMT
jgi:hypothetical protein